jgi:hypothetical protein
MGLMADSIDALKKISELTGLKRSDTEEIVKMVRENQLRLDDCPRHDFSVPLDRHTKKPIDSPVIFCDWQCTHCRGWVNGEAKRWYLRGLKHATPA